MKKSKALIYFVATLASAVLFSGAMAQTRKPLPPKLDLEDKFLNFEDLGVRQSNSGLPKLYWLSEFKFIFQATSAMYGAKDEIAVYDLSAKRLTKVKENAFVSCWLPEKREGVAGLQAQVGDKPTFVKMIETSSGEVVVTDVPALRADCFSKATQQLMKTDIKYSFHNNFNSELGALFIPDEAHPGVGFRMTNEGEAIPLPKLTNGGYGRPNLIPWLGFVVGWFRENESYGEEPKWLIYTVKGEFKSIQQPTVTKYFAGINALLTKVGYLHSTGISDQYPSGLYFVPGDGSKPFRVYKSRGPIDLVGARSVSPSGCGVLITMAPSGPINRLLTFGGRVDQTLHYVNVCDEFTTTIEMETFNEQ